MIGKVTEEKIRVRYGETDMMGHAYYGNYLLWFEVARGAWCRDRGYTYKQIEEAGYKLPVVEVWSRYKGEIKYDDLIIVRIWLAEIKRSSLNFKYEILNTTTGKTVTEAYTWQVMIGSEARAVTIPPELRAMLERNPDEYERVV